MTSVCTNYTKANRYGILPHKTEDRELLKSGKRGSLAWKKLNCQC